MSGQYDNADETQSNWWTSVFRQEYRDLSQLIARLSGHYLGRDLIPEDQASDHIQNTESQLEHVTGKLAPKRTQLGDIWTRDVTTVITASKQNGSIVEGERALALDDLANWDGGTTAVEVDGSGRCASSTREVVRGYLPPRAMKALNRQIEEAIEHLGWSDGAAMQDYVAGNDEVLRHE